MERVLCPTCGAPVPSALISPVSDRASCPGCGAAFKPSEAPRVAEAVRPFSVERPPRGVTFAWAPRGFVIRAKTRSPVAFFIVPFTLVWTGFTLSFLYIGPLFYGEGPGFLSLFGLPFLAVSVFLSALSAMMLFGHVRVSADGLSGEVFTGIGGIGRRRRFDWSDIAEAREDIRITTTMRDGRRRKSRTAQVCLEGNERILFGSLLSDERRFYLVKALGYLLARLQGRPSPDGFD